MKDDEARHRDSEMKDLKLYQNNFQLYVLKMHGSNLHSTNLNLTIID